MLLCLSHEGFMAAPGSLFGNLQRREAGARPSSSRHVIAARSPQGRPETPEELGKRKVPNPVRVARGRAKKEPAVEEAGGAAPAGVPHLQGQHHPRSGAPTSREDGDAGRKRGRGLGSRLAPRVPPAGPVGHYSLLTFIIRLAGRKESGRNSGLNGSLKCKCLNKASSSLVPFQCSRAGKTGKRGFKAGNLEVSTSGLICSSRKGRDAMDVHLAV